MVLAMDLSLDLFSLRIIWYRVIAICVITVFARMLDLLNSDYHNLASGRIGYSCGFGSLD